MVKDVRNIQICDRIKLTAKRSLELEEERRNNLINWAVSQIVGEDEMEIDEEEDEKNSACGGVVECSVHDGGGVEVACNRITHTAGLYIQEVNEISITSSN